MKFNVKLACIVLFCFVSLAVSAQSEIDRSINFIQNTFNLQLGKDKSVEPLLAFDKSKDAYISVAIKWTDTSAELEYSIDKKGSGFSEWTPIIIDFHVLEELPTAYNQSLLILGSDAKSMKVRNVSKVDFESMDVFGEITYDLATQRDKSGSYSTERYECSCEEIPFVNREGWGCPWGDESPNFTPNYSKISHMVVHHQAGNAPPPYASVVRAIWNYHVNTNGWDDIGYNWLIAPDGVVYKGRAWLNGDENVRGAHTCACNSNKMGICMLGDFTDSLPPTAQYDGLKDFLVWKACSLSILPDGKDAVSKIVNNECVEQMFANISGHKDVCGANYTACPGNAFYPKLQTLKNEVIDQFYACADTLSTATNDFHSNVISLQFEEGGLTITCSKEGNQLSELHLYSINGSQLFVTKNKTQVYIPTHSYPKGIYILTGRILNKAFSKKIIL